MLKRLLAFVLAAALIVETPATAYAAEQTPVTVEDGAQDLVGGGDEADTSSQDGTGIVDNGNSSVEIVEDGKDDSSVDTDTVEIEDSDESNGTDEAGNTADENVSEDVVSDAASESSSDDAVVEAEEPLNSIAENIRLVTGGDVLKAEAYGFEDTFTVAPAEDAAEDAVLADSYTLSMSISGGTLDGQSLVYAPDGLDSDPVDIVLAKNEEDASASYSKTLCSSDFYYIDSENNKTTLTLSPETQYTLAYSLEWDSEISPVTGTIEFTTAQADMSEPMADEAGDSSVITVSVKPDITSASINFTLNAGINYGDYVICYYKEKDAQDWTYGGSRNFWGYYDFEPFTITGLKSETEHEYKIGSSSNDNTSADALENPVEGKFTTLADNRKVTVTVEPKVSSAVINYTLSGNLSHSDYIICYYKAKDAQDWTKIDYWWGDNYYPFMISGLSAATEYDYKIGFASNDNTPAADLEKAEEGKFTTLAENRKVTATVEPKIKKATVNYTLSGGYDDNGWIYCFYKEKDATNWTYEIISIGTEEAAASADYKDSFVLEGLKPATEYNYKIGFADDEENLTPDKLKGVCAESTFTTLADQRKLSNAKAEVVESGSAPKIKLNAFFSGNIENDYTYIHYFYKEKVQAGTEAAAAWEYSSTVTTNSAQRYCLQSITDGIEWGKNYEYVIVISDRDYYNYYDDTTVNPDEITEEGFKLTGTVEVPAAKAPTSVTLSQKEIYLNVGSVGEGCDYQRIKADIAPADANKALICSSEDSSVAYAYYEDGSIIVEAYGVGTTTIKVRSPYSTDPNAVLDEIKVEVVNYSIFIKDNGTVDTENPMSSVYYSKFTDGKFIESKEEYLLYKWDKDTAAWTPAEGFKVTSENESIVTWKEGENKLVTGKSVGRADLVFTDAEGKFKARLTVNTSSAYRAFAITGLTNSTYAAIEKEGVYTIPNNYSYTAVVKFNNTTSLSDYSILSMFNWESKNTNVATVNNGIITPIGPGEATIIAKLPKETGITAFNGDQLADASIKIKVVELPTIPPSGAVYVLANTVTKLSEVKPPEGWEWKVPDTPIVINAAHSTAYSFDAVYTKGDKYPVESTISVYIAQVTGMSVYGNSDAVLEVAKSSTDADNDSLTLTVNTIARGRFNSSTKANGYEDYHIEIPDVTGLSIVPVKPQNSDYDANGLSSSGSQQFTIKAQKAGNYTLKPAIYVKDAKGNQKLLAKTTYKLKAVDASLAEKVEIQLTAESNKNTSIKMDNDGRLYIDLTPSNEVDAAAADSVKEFDVEAILKDWKDAAKTGASATTVTSESLKDTKLTWKVSDAKVATVKADSANSQKAKVTVKGEGHTIITATAKDAAGHSAQLKIEIRNHAPRVNVSKVTVNTAFDYNSYYGKYLAQSAGGSVEIVPVYGEYVKEGSAKLYENGALSSSLQVYENYDEEDYTYVIGTKSAGVSAGKHNVELRVTTNNNKTYKYPIQVTVVNKPAKITAKSVNTVNLFYTNDEPEVSFKISGATTMTMPYEDGEAIASVKWTDKSSGVGNGFSEEWSRDYSDDVSTEYWYAEQENISLTNKNKPSDANIAKGEFTVKLYGYRDAYTVPVTIKCNYKKPSIVTYKNSKAAASTTIEPSAGSCNNSFYLYDKTNKRYVYYGNNDYAAESYWYYHDLICDNKNVEMEPYSTGNSRVDYKYTASKTSGSEKIEFKLASNVWREDITVKHTIKIAKPTAALTFPQIVINTNTPAINYTSIYLKNSGYALTLSDVKVEGKDAKSTKLLEDDLLEIYQTSDYKSWVYVRQNNAKIMGKDSINAGTYSYKLTPYYTDDSGNKKALNTVVLKVKVINKDITVKTKVKNTLDLVKGAAYYNYMEITPTFSNIGTNYTVNDVKLTGEYSKYFVLDEIKSNGYSELQISSTGVGKLKAGQSYKLTLEYKVSMRNGDEFTVTSKPITVKPKQTAPKVRVYDNNQTIYAGADDVSRYYRLETDAYKFKYNGTTRIVYPYSITGVSGGLDCNKDGKEDISVVLSSGGSSCWVRVEFNEWGSWNGRDGALTATGAKGKTYSIPVTVTLRGRDGISRDVKTTIKVTVKR